MRRLAWLFAAVALCGADKAFGGEWWYVGDTNNMIVFGDRSTARSDAAAGRSVVEVWYYLRHKQPIESGAKTEKQLRYVDCKRNEMMIKSYVEYAESGTPLKSNTFSEYSANWQPAAPDSIGYFMNKFACNISDMEGAEKYKVEDWEFFRVQDVDLVAKKIFP